jgi:cytochrome c biogenesis protein CcmG, thiol:disulfide interchange protein DsbE
LSDITEVARRRPSRKVLIVIGCVLAIALIAVVSVLTGGHVNTKNGQAISPLVGKTIKVYTARGVTSASVESPWANGHPTVIVFFGSWCTICHTEMPKIAAYLRTHSVAPVSVFGDDNNEPLSDARAFVKKLNLNFPVASDPNNNISVGVFDFSFGDPETVFLNKHGVVKEVHLGAISIKQLKQGIAALASA